jgi:hypothetical protein
MSRAEWLRKRLDASVAQGIGQWMDVLKDGEFGQGIFAFDNGTAVRIFEDGLTYGKDPVRKIRYNQIVGLELLDLRALMHAQKAPDRHVQMTVNTAAGQHILDLPLFHYTALAGILNAIATDGK